MVLFAKAMGGLESNKASQAFLSTHNAYLRAPSWLGWWSVRPLIAGLWVQTPRWVYRLLKTFKTNKYISALIW